ncbi:PREDICTED: uncharacterized protein LOC109582357 [Amphimedon queenslandica]|uniref:Uncharacterized protein n=1 Tax=Amphimedon queenslandica TaxID=400682 RepID=A0AAN0J773_AMPQE|nr:PREDICTED: uncharacterized protein LOC109582357 [Amphimedon queenslandica]|eukprot:XP_019852586.1 PREDICTED: uncharacterized protein LOC109582357 [Amphimedon queenslandica]
MEEKGLIPMDDSLIKFCVSWFSIRVANIGTIIAIESWNQHTLRGRKNGTPNEIMRRANMTAYVQPSVLPETEDAVREMESLGSNLTYFSGFGIDPLQGQVHLIEERDRLFRQRYPDFGPFFHSVVNRDFHHFQQGLLFFIDKTRNLL